MIDLASNEENHMLIENLKEVLKISNKNKNKTTLPTSSKRAFGTLCKGGDKNKHTLRGGSRPQKSSQRRASGLAGRLGEAGRPISIYAGAESGPRAVGLLRQTPMCA